MTGRTDQGSACGGAVTCPRCGKRFTCGPTGKCWCRGEAFRLPLPPAGAMQDCYCPDCLPVVAAEMLARLGGAVP
jgi:hypothetical protein